MPQEYKGPERRKFQRFIFASDSGSNQDNLPEVHIKIGEDVKSARLIDLCEGGICVLTNHMIPSLAERDIKFQIQFELTTKDQQTRLVSAEGQVRYSLQLADENQYRVGIQFVAISEKDRQTIADFIKSAAS